MYTPQNWAVFTPQYSRDFTNPLPYNSQSDVQQPCGRFPSCFQLHGESSNLPDAAPRCNDAYSNGSVPNTVSKKEEDQSSTHNSEETGSFSEYGGEYRSSTQYCGGSYGYAGQQSGSTANPNLQSSLPGYKNHQFLFQRRPVCTSQDDRVPVHSEQPTAKQAPIGAERATLFLQQASKYKSPPYVGKAPGFTQATFITHEQANIHPQQAHGTYNSYNPRITTHTYTNSSGYKGVDLNYQQGGAAGYSSQQQAEASRHAIQQLDGFTTGFTNQQKEGYIVQQLSSATGYSREPLAASVSHQGRIIYQPLGRAVGYSNQQQSKAGYQQQEGASQNNDQQFSTAGYNFQPSGNRSYSFGKTETGSRQGPENGIGTQYYGRVRGFIQSSFNVHQFGRLPGSLSHSIGGYGDTSNYSTANATSVFSESQQSFSESIPTTSFVTNQNPESQAYANGFSEEGISTFQERRPSTPPAATPGKTGESGVDASGMPISPTSPIQDRDDCIHNKNSSCYCTVHGTNKLQHNEDAPLDIENIPPLDVEDLLLTHRFLSLGTSTKETDEE